MKIFRILATALSLSTISILAAAQPMPNPREGVFSDQPAYPSSYVVVDEVRMHYVDSGSETKDPSSDRASEQVFLFLHGNPTSSYLWRNVMPYVEPLGRVIAVDLIGFGKSGKPESDFTLQDHSRFVDGFIDALNLKDIVLVIHDWGSMLGFDYARRNARNVKGIAFMEAIVPPAYPASSYEAMGPMGDLFRQFRDAKTGKALLIDQNMFIEELLIKGAVTRTLSEVEADAYREPFTDPASRKPIYVWPNELPIGGHPARNVKAIEAAGEWLKTSGIPKLLLYVRPGAIVSPESAAWMRDHYRNIETVFVGYGRHYIQEDNPEVIGRNIADWYMRQFGK